MKAIVGICTIAALGLAGCGGSSNDFVAGPADPTPTTDPFGNDFETPISGLAAFIRSVGDPLVDGPVAEHDAIEVTFHADGSFALTTPAGDVLEFDAEFTERFDETLDDDIFTFTNEGGDVLEVVHGFDAAENRIFDIARLDEGGVGDGFEAYGVIGNETEAANLPTGSATYSGSFLASLFSEGVAFTDEFKGTSIVTADFAKLTVTNTMDGSYDVDGVTFTGFMDSTATLTGSQYTGDLTAFINTPNLGWGFPTLEIFPGGDGVLAGAFYGLTGEATAGAFAGRDVFFDNVASPHPLEIVGGFAAEIVPAP